MGLLAASVYGNWWQRSMPPTDISSNGQLIDGLWNYTTALCIFYFILVCLGLFGFSYLYSRKRHKTPYYTYGNKKQHIIVTAIIGAAVFLTIDLNITRIASNDLLQQFWKYPDPKTEKVLRVEVMAQQWMWSFRYAGADGKFATADDVVTNNDLRVPVNTKVLFHLTSKDVIHSFWVPNVRVKVDTIPGRVTRVWWDANVPGVYDIVCAEMCGANHYRMKAQLTVYTEKDFQKWVGSSQEIANITNDPDDVNQAWGWKWEI
ncbi:MAG TPA: cytochrome c oxidase subunit II [Bacteriovoracaceae bacterium]|nr:cytochrome c oxidase subunit II [Bacteriovoracaceae bacterium]